MTNTKRRARHARFDWDSYVPPTPIPWPSDLELDTLPALKAPKATQLALPSVPRSRATYKPSGLPTPILALDVDGPLNVYRASLKRLRSRAGGFEEVRGFNRKLSFRAGSRWFPYSDLWLSRAHGEMLAEFSRVHDVELVWATMWEHNANTIIGPALGLPRLPWVDFHSHTSRAWKWDAVAEFAAGRPLAWLDDSFLEPRKVAQRKASGWAAARRNLPTLLQHVDPAVGLRTSDLDAVAEWLKTARLAW